MPYSREGLVGDRSSLRDVKHVPFWLDDPRRPDPEPELEGTSGADLVVVGGGLTGLWTALLAAEREPGRSVVLLEADRVAGAAAGRNGGFVASSLTHGVGNGLARWPGEMPELVRMGHRNLDEIEQTVARLGIDCAFVRNGEVDVAVDPHQVDELATTAAAGIGVGERFEFLDADRARQLVDSPRVLGGLLDRSGVALVNPARLAWGLRQHCLSLGVRIHEGTEVTGIDVDGAGVRVESARGSVRAARVAVATGAARAPLRGVRRFIVPVYDYVLVTEPLSEAQWASIGWRGREGISDAGNQFHYSRVTEDGRILWGGYDALYHWGSATGPALEHHHASYARLATHLFEFLPQLRGLRFTHAWGGAIDTSSRFTAFWRRSHSDRVVFAGGFTGLGVGASRFAALVTLDLLAGQETDRTRLSMVGTRPLPFPPEPFRSLGIAMTTRSLDRADRQGGRRNAWLRALDRIGLGFDS